jgi:hypothetical protein
MAHLSDDEAVAKMGTRWWWFGQMWATRPQPFCALPLIDTETKIVIVELGRKAILSGTQLRCWFKQPAAIFELSCAERMRVPIAS